MSELTAISYLGKIFSKISVVFGLFFAVLAIAFQLGIISDFWFNFFFMVCLFLVLIDLTVKFVCKQFELIHIHKLEMNWIALNYGTYREAINTKKKDSFQDVLESLGKETLTTLLGQTQEKLKEAKSKKTEKKLLTRLEEIQAQKQVLERLQE